MRGYIYLIQEREFFSLGLPIYKIGKTVQKDPHNRIKCYPKSSNLILLIQCENPSTIEINLINVLKTEFIQKKNIGKEYFYGDVNRMKRVVLNHVLNVSTILKRSILRDTIQQYTMKNFTLC